MGFMARNEGILLQVIAIGGDVAFLLRKMTAPLCWGCLRDGRRYSNFSRPILCCLALGDQGQGEGKGHGKATGGSEEVGAAFLK
jgi:hypothetical protein